MGDTLGAPYRDTLLFMELKPPPSPFRIQLVVMTPNGFGRQPIPGLPDDIGWVRWSPDGRQISFISYDRDIGSGIGIANADGSNLRFLDDTGQYGGFGWSPDSLRLVYCDLSLEGLFAGHSTGDTLHLIDVDGTNKKVIGDLDVNEAYPDWSPDGKLIVFTAGQEATSKSELFVVTNTGKERRQLTHLDGFVRNPRWSPDGRKIAFTYGEIPHRQRIYVMDADGGNPAPVADFSDFAVDYPIISPAWSPTGRSLVFSAKRGDPRLDRLDLYVVNVETGAIRQVTDTPDIHEGGVDWYGSSLDVDPSGKLPTTWGSLRLIDAER